MRLDIRRTAQIKKGEEVIGSRSKVKVVKNKVAAPFKVAEFDIMYNEGISKEGDLISLGVKIGIVNKSGNTYSFGEDKLGVGYDASREFLKQNPKISSAISKEIYKKAGM
jgi:recombination protein RecA